MLSTDQLVANPQIIDLKYFIKTERKINIFFKTFNLKKNMSQILDIHLS